MFSPVIIDFWHAAFSSGGVEPRDARPTSLTRFGTWEVVAPDAA
jgi:hypothetical protein